LYAKLSYLPSATVGDLDLSGASTRWRRSDSLNSLHDVLTSNDHTEHTVLAIQMRGGHGGDEELRAVGVGTGVGHGQQEWSVVLEGKVLISKLVAVDGLPTSAITTGEITTLQHKVGNDSVKDGILEVKRLAGSASALLASAQGAEVLSSLGGKVVSQDELDGTSGLTTDGNIEENLVAGLRVLGVRSHLLKCKS